MSNTQQTEQAAQQLPWWLPDPIIVFFIGFLALMYFMTIRPQQKRMKALQTMMDGLEKGDEVVAAGGIIGRIKEIKGPYVSIEVSENITFKLQKTAIANTLPKGTIASID
jgi:preprotein translocase subunit YajC